MGAGGVGGGAMSEAWLQLCDYLFIPICRGIKRDKWQQRSRYYRQRGRCQPGGRQDGLLTHHRCFIKLYTLDAAC